MLVGEVRLARQVVTTGEYYGYDLSWQTGLPWVIVGGVVFTDDSVAGLRRPCLCMRHGHVPSCTILKGYGERSELLTVQKFYHQRVLRPFFFAASGSAGCHGPRSVIPK